MTCPGCGKDVSQGAEQCPGCGCALASAAAPVPSADQPTEITPPSADRPTEITPASSGSDPSDMPTRIEAPSMHPTGNTTGFAPGSPAAFQAIRPGATLGGRYEIVSVLGEGGMGIVYRAQDVKLVRDVALKVIRPELMENPAIAERFRREILLASRITHKNILRIHDLVESDGLAYLSMNFVEGKTLSRRIREEKQLAVDEAVRLGIQLCDAMQAAHEEGVIHRDLKPQNVLLDEEGMAYIADFGISRSLEAGETMTRAGQVLGTINYMSPEQARGETTDHRGDIYSLGMVMYKMLTGELPFDAEAVSSVQGMLRRVQEDVPELTTVRPDIPQWLSSVVSKSLQRDPAERYQSSAEMKRDLESHAAAKTVRSGIKPKTLVRGLAALLAVAAIALGVVLVPRLLPEGDATTVAAPATAPKASLALLPFQNATGDTAFDWTGSGLADLLQTDLMQTEALRLVESDRVHGVLDGLKISTEIDLRDDTLHRVAGLLGADNVLTARLLKAGETFRIEASVQRITGGKVTAGETISVEGQGEQSLFEMVDDLTERIRDDLDLTARRGERDVSDVATASLDALRFYQQGLALARAGNHLDAATGLEQAVQADPEFAVARATLAETYDQLGRYDDAVAEADRALERLNKVSTHEAARIRAIKAWLDYDLPAAATAYTELTRVSPNSAAAFFGLATVQEEQGDLEAAMNALQRVLLLDPKHAEAQYALGRVHAKSANTAEALAALNAALVTHIETENDEGRATVLNGIGNTYLSISQYDEALERYEKALEIRERIGDRSGVYTTLSNIAEVLSGQERLDEAITKQQQALAIMEELGDPSGLAEAYYSLGDFLHEAGRPEESLDAYEESMKIVRDLGDEASLAWNLSSVGYVNTVMGNYVQAYFFLQDALEKRREIGDKEEIVNSLIRLGILEQIQGRYEQAIALYMEGLELSREVGDRESNVALSLNLSNIDEDQGEYGAALERLEEAEAAARKIGNQHLIAACLADIGTTRLRLGDLEGAEAALVDALALARELNHKPLMAKVLTQRSALLEEQGRTDEIAATVREAVQAAENAKEHRLLLIAHLRAAESAGAKDELERVLAEAESSGLAPLVTQAHLALARLHLDARRAQEAVDEAENAIESAEELNQRDLLFEARRIAGIGAARRGDKIAAVEHYLAALDLLEGIRRGLDGDALGSLLSRSRTTEFRRDAEELLTALNRTEELDRLRQVTE